MRTVLSAIVVALGVAAAQPAFAGEGAAPVGVAPLLHVTAADLDDLGAVPGKGPNGASGAAASPFRLAATLALIGGAAAGKDGALLRHRLGTGMLDYYPSGDTGFHLSAGSRLFQRRNFVAETEASARGLMAGPKALVGGTTTRAGFKKFNPALTAGYSMAMSRMTRIGIEAGAMMSGAFTNTPGLSRFGVGYRGEHEFRPDAIVNAAFGLKF